MPLARLRRGFRRIVLTTSGEMPHGQRWRRSLATAGRRIAAGGTRLLEHGEARYATREELRSIGLDGPEMDEPTREVAMNVTSDLERFGR